MGCVNTDLCVIERNLPFRQKAMGHKKFFCEKLAFSIA